MQNIVGIVMGAVFMYTDSTYTHNNKWLLCPERVIIWLLCPERVCRSIAPLMWSGDISNFQYMI